MHKRRASKAVIGLGLFCAVSAVIWWWYVHNKNVPPEISKQNLSEFFRQFASNGLLPIIRPGGQKVGSVYSAKDARWIYESSTCFPTLMINTPVPSSLPSISINGDVDASIALGAGALVSGSVDSKSIRSAKIQFSDVQVEEVPESALRNSFDAKNCPELGPIIESVLSGQPPVGKVEPLLVISSLYRAKRTLIMEIKTKAAANETLGNLARAIKIRGELQANDAGDFTLTLQNELPLPVAATVAFIPSPVGATLGGQAPKPETIWVPFDPKLNPRAISTLQSILDPDRTQDSAVAPGQR
jgi:hypothetical protein